MEKKKVSFEELLGFKRMQEISLERLIPPKSVEEIQEAYESNESSSGIDFSYLTHNSSFQRAIMEFIKKFVPGMENIKHRGSKEIMKQSFNQNASNYRGVMNEFTEKVERLRKK